MVNIVTGDVTFITHLHGKIQVQTHLQATHNATIATANALKDGRFDGDFFGGVSEPCCLSPN